jgi:hypothetical protein
MDGEVARGATTRDAHIYVKDNQHRIHATFADTHPCPACLHECITQVLASVALLRDVAPNEVDSHATKGTCARQSGGSVWRGQPDDRRWADGDRLNLSPFHLAARAKGRKGESRGGGGGAAADGGGMRRRMRGRGGRRRRGGRPVAAGRRAQPPSMRGGCLQVRGNATHMSRTGMRNVSERTANRRCACTPGADPLRRRPPARTSRRRARPREDSPPCPCKSDTSNC